MIRRAAGLVGYAFLVVSAIGLIWRVGEWAVGAWQDRRPGICVRGLQEYVSAAAPEADPVVTKCAGWKHSALCFVESLENGQRRTYPF